MSSSKINQQYQYMEKLDKSHLMDQCYLNKSQNFDITALLEKNCDKQSSVLSNIQNQQYFMQSNKNTNKSDSVNRCNSQFHNESFNKRDNSYYAKHCKISQEKYDNLSNAYQIIQKQNSQMKRDLDQKNMEIQQLVKKNEEKLIYFNQQIEIVNCKLNEAVKLEKEVEQKNQLINQLKEELNLRESQIYNKEQQIQRKLIELESKNKEQMNFQEKLIQKESSIYQQISEIQNSQQQLQQQQLKLGRLIQYHEQLIDSIEQKEGMVKQYESIVSKQNKQLNDLIGQVSEHENSILGICQHIQQTESKFKFIESNIGNKMEYVDIQEQEIKMHELGLTMNEELFIRKVHNSNQKIK